MSVTKRKRKRKLSSPSAVDRKVFKESDVEPTRYSPEYSGNDDEFAELPNNQENKEDYGPFGYMPVNIGQQIHNFTIIRKTGVGTFSTVWLGYDKEKRDFAALKISKSDSKAVKLFNEEYQMLTNIKNQDETCLGYNRVIHILSRIMVGKAEHMHNCLVFKPIGTSLYSKILKSETGLEVVVLRKLSQQILEGLCFLHEHCNLIHSDIKSDNILVTMPRKQLYGLVHRVMMEDYQGLGMRMNADEEYFASSDSSELKSNFETITSHFRSSAIDIGASVDSKSLNFVDESVLRWKNETEFLTDTALNTGKALEIITTDKDKNTKCMSKSALVTKELLDPEIQVKIIDLGGAVPVSKRTTRVVSTFEFRAPEVILGDYITTSADIWSFACTFYEMATARHLFYSDEMPEESEKELLDEIISTMNSFSKVDGTPFQRAELYKTYFNKRGKYKHTNACGVSLTEKFNLVFDKSYSQQMMDFVKPMLTFDPKSRPTARQCLNHGFLMGPN